MMDLDLATQSVLRDCAAIEAAIDGIELLLLLVAAWAAGGIVIGVRNLRSMKGGSK